MKKIIFIAVFLLLNSVSLQAEQTGIPDGHGKDLVQSKCSACHGLDFILHGNYSAAQWGKIVEDMVKAGLKVTPEEKNTILTYLTANFAKGTGGPLPPVPAGSETKQPETAASAAPEMTLGQTLYEKNCAFCHRNKGTGIEGAMPPLAGNQAIAKESRYNIQTVLYGLSGQITVLENLYNGSMPGFSHLTDQEIAEVINYYTAAWDNKADFQAVKDSDVAAERKTAKTPDKVRQYRAELCKDKK